MIEIVEAARVGRTCPLCSQENWAGIYPPHTRGPRETKISWEHRGKLVLWTSQVGQVVSVRYKKRHNLRLTMHADVASFNAAAKHVNRAGRMQKNGGLKHEISSDLFDVEVEPGPEGTVRCALGEPCCQGSGCGCSKRK